MSNIEKIVRKNKVAKDFIEKISTEQYFDDLKNIDRSLSFFKKDIENTGVINKTKQDLQDFLVSENIFEWMSDSLFKRNLSTIAFLSKKGKIEIDKAKKIINNSDNEQEARKKLKLKTTSDIKTTKTDDIEQNNTVDKNNLTTIIAGTAEIEIKGFDENMAKLVISDLKDQGITNLYVIKAILSTIAKESKFNSNIAEISYKNTSNGRIRNIFWARIKDLSDDELTALKADNEKFWDRVYGPDDPTWMSQKYQNTEKGDGLKYRGRWFNGLTFKSNYRKYGKMINEDLVWHPELLSDPKIASKVNAAYFKYQMERKYTKKKYNYKNINDITDFDTALDIVININAGIWKNLNSKNLQENRDRALVASQNFEFKNIT